MFSRTQTYHRKCFNCGICKRPLDSVLACDGPDKDIYCRFLTILYWSKIFDISLSKEVVTARSLELKVMDSREEADSFRPETCQ